MQRAVASLAYYKGYFMRGQGQWPALDRCVGEGGMGNEEGGSQSLGRDGG